MQCWLDFPSAEKAFYYLALEQRKRKPLYSEIMFINAEETPKLIHLVTWRGMGMLPFPCPFPPSPSSPWWLFRPNFWGSLLLSLALNSARERIHFLSIALKRVITIP